MPLQFTVLASGSSGNASLLVANGFGVLLDAGLGPRQLLHRLTAIGASWNHVQAVVLTHTHSDHWKDRTFAHMCRRCIPLYCHPQHHENLLAHGQAFATLRAANLVRGYEAGAEFDLAPGLCCRPLPLRHDGGATFGFRFDIGDGDGRPTHALAYAADLGSWSAELAEHLADVDLLALEFNHDVDLEHGSGRAPELIARVLGADGHLSNVQAGALLREVLQMSPPGRLRHVIQLHLSRDCNHPTLAAAAARQVLADLVSSIELHTASQHEPGRTLVLSSGLDGAAVNRPTATPSRRLRPKIPVQLSLPGMED